MKQAFTLLCLLIISESQYAQISFVDPCFMSGSIGTSFINTADLTNDNADLMVWDTTSLSWTGSWPLANLQTPPINANGSCRAIFVGNGQTWTTGGEGFGVRLTQPLVAGQNYSITVDYVSDGFGSDGAFSPMVYSSNSTNVPSGNFIGNLPAVGYSWTANIFCFTATAAQNGDTWIIFFTGPNGTSGMINSFCVGCNLPVSVLSIGNDTAVCQGGDVVLNATTGGATYLWQDGSTGPTDTAINPGQYWVQVTQGACVSSDTLTLSSLPAPLVNLGNDTAVCPGQNVLLDAGNTGATYLWSNNSTNETLLATSTGTYSVSVTVPGGCSASGSINVSQNVLSVNIAGIPGTCGNLNDTATANVTGTGPFTYTWSNNASTQFISGIAAGTYTVTVTSTGSCTATASADITVNASLALNLAVINTTCGLDNGTVMATANGTVPYRYLWSTGDTSSSISSLAPTNYAVTVTDATGCSASTTQNVQSSVALGMLLSANNTSCGLNNGTTAVNITTGTAPYSYSWNTGDTVLSLNNLQPSTYALTVTDSAGCSATSTIAVASSVADSITPGVTNTTCGLSNGVLAVNVISGTQPYTYLWNNGNALQTINNLMPGNYSVTITDSLGCSATVAASIAASVGDSILITLGNATCSNNNGSANANVLTGTSPFTYLWSTGDTTSTVSNLPQGNYMVTVTDMNGCSASAGGSIAVTGADSIAITSGGTSCGNNNGNAAITVLGGTSPYTYNWNTGDTLASIANLAAGNYSVTLTDANGCSAIATATISPSLADSVSITSNKLAFCAGDSSYVCATAGFASYTWNTGQTDTCIYANQAGDYYVSVTDNNGCTAASNHLAISVYTPPSTSIAVNNDSLTAYNEVAYQWYFDGNLLSGDTSSSLIATQSGNYTVLVTDSNGCQALSNPAVLNIGGVINLACNPSIHIYPNPIQSGTWHLEVSDAWLGSPCKIFDSEGRVVYEALITEALTSISLKVAGGVYVMQLQNGEKTAVVKLIKL